MKLSSSKGALFLAPESGGCVAAFQWQGRDILRPLNTGSSNSAPTDYAAFPLFPFSGRIANARFSFESKDYALSPNFPPESHAIHGNAWQSIWQMGEASVHSAVMLFEHAGKDWPWPYRAEQVFNLTDDGLRVDLTLTNLSGERMPGGVGWHPYFPRGDATLEADVSSVWLSGDDMIPSAPSPLTPQTDLTLPQAVKDLRLDNAFSAGTGGSRMRWEEQSISIAMTASETLRHLVAYTPEGEDFFCVEPVSHSPDALNSNLTPEITGLQILDPGQSLSASIELKVDG